MTKMIRKPVAFVVTIRGTIDWEAEDSPNAMTPAQEFAAATVRETMSDVIYLLQESRDAEITIKPDDSRNYPDGLGGYAMPTPTPIVMCDCGRTDWDQDGCCVGCGQHVSEVG